MLWNYFIPSTGRFCEKATIKSSFMRIGRVEGLKIQLEVRLEVVGLHRSKNCFGMNYTRRIQGGPESFFNSSLSVAIEKFSGWHAFFIGVELCSYTWFPVVYTWHGQVLWKCNHKMEAARSPMWVELASLYHHPPILRRFGAKSGKKKRNSHISTHIRHLTEPSYQVSFFGPASRIRNWLSGANDLWRNHIFHKTCPREVYFTNR